MKTRQETIKQPQKDQKPRQLFKKSLFVQQKMEETTQNTEYAKRPSKVITHNNEPVLQHVLVPVWASVNVSAGLCRGLCGSNFPQICPTFNICVCKTGAKSPTEVKCEWTRLVFIYGVKQNHLLAAWSQIKEVKQRKSSDNTYVFCVDLVETVLNPAVVRLVVLFLSAALQLSEETSTRLVWKTDLLRSHETQQIKVSSCFQKDALWNWRWKNHVWFKQSPAETSWCRMGVSAA